MEYKHSEGKGRWYSDDELRRQICYLIDGRNTDAHNNKHHIKKHQCKSSHVLCDFVILLVFHFVDIIHFV